MSQLKGHIERKPVVRVSANPNDSSELIKMATGVKWIINCAELLEHEDADEFDRCNVHHVNQLVDAAVACNVPYLLHMSSALVCCGTNSNYFAAENTAQVPRQHLLPHYGRSKYEAELLVERANGRPLGDNFGRLRTLTLRPTIMYGELDPWFVCRAMKIANTFHGTLPRISNVYTRIQPCYVGNVAWAVLCAKKRIERDASVGGEAFFVTDDTPISDPFDFWQPFLTRRKLKISRWYIPLYLLILFLNLLHLALRVLRSIRQVRLGNEWNPQWWNTMCTTHFFNRTKITLRLDYDPLYSPDKAVQQSQTYYEKCSYS